MLLDVPNKFWTKHFCYVFFCFQLMKKKNDIYKKKYLNRDLAVFFLVNRVPSTEELLTWVDSAEIGFYRIRLIKKGVHDATRTSSF